MAKEATERNGGRMRKTERRGGRTKLSYEQSIRLWWVRLAVSAMCGTIAVVAVRPPFIAVGVMACAIVGAFAAGFSYAEWLRSEGKTSWAWGDPASRGR